MGLFTLTFWRQCLPAISFLCCAPGPPPWRTGCWAAAARLARRLGHPHIALVAEAF